MAARPAGVLGAKGITRREAEVLEVLREGLTNAEIAARLFISERTVESHVASLLRKLEAPSRRVLVDRAASLTKPVHAVPPQLSMLTEMGPFVGRDAEVATLVEWLLPPAPAAPRAAVVTGEAGIGKSRLVAELALVAQDAGVAVLLGQCFEDLTRPYEPFVQALGADLATVDDFEARRRVGGNASQLTRLLPALSDRLTNLAATVRERDPGVDRLALQDAVAGYLVRASRYAPVLLVVEDIHWAPGGTLELIRHLCRTAGARLSLLITARDTSPELSEELAEGLAALQRDPVVRHVRLAGLDRLGVRALVSAVRPSPGEVARDRLVSTLLAQTGGNPLFVRELAQVLDERSYREPVLLAGSLREVLATRFRRLSPADQAVLDVATVIGAEFDLSLLSASAAVPPVEVAEVLERAERAGLVVGLLQRAGRFAFAHALLRSARYSSLPAAMRLRLHRSVADALEGHPEADVADLARHWCAAAPLGGAMRAVRYARLAAERARASVALAEAILHYEAALQAADLMAEPQPAMRCDLLTGYGEALHRIGDPRHRGVLMKAAALAEGLDAERLARVVFALNEHGWASRIGALDEVVAQLAQQALEGVGPAPSATRARLLAILAAEFNLTSYDERRHPLIKEALATARQLDDPRVLGEVLVCHYWAGFDPDNLAERVAVADEIIGLGEALGDRALVLQGHACRYVTSLEGGHVEAADGELALMDRSARELELPFFLVRVLRAHARRASHAGKFAEAERFRREILALGKAAGLAYVTTVAGHVAALVAMDAGPRSETLAEAERAAGEPSGYRLPQAILAELLLAAGRTTDARAQLVGLAGREFRDVPRNVSWLATLSLFGHVAAVTRDQPSCRLLRRLLMPYSGRIGWSGFPVFSVDLVLGCLAVALGGREAALQHLDAAEALASRMGARTHVARARLHRAVAVADGQNSYARSVRATADLSLQEMSAMGAHAVLGEARLLSIPS